MIKKNVLLASAALMGLGAVDAVHADETKTADNKAAVVAAIEEVEANNTIVFATPAEIEEEVDEEEIDDEEVDDEEVDEEEVDEEEIDDEEVDGEEVDEEEIDDEEYVEQINEMNAEFEALQELADALLEEDEVDVQEFLDAYFNDVVELHENLLEFIEANGESEEAAELLDQLTAYLEEVEPTVNEIVALLEALENGDITDEEFDNKFFEVLGFVDEDEQEETTPEVEAPKTKTPEAEEKKEVKPNTEAPKSEKKTESQKNDDHAAKLTEWSNRFEALMNKLEDVKFDNNFDVNAFWGLAYTDVFNLYQEIEAFAAEHGTTDEIAELLDILTEYLNTVGDALDQVEKWMDMVDAGDITFEQFLDLMAELFGDEAVEEEVKSVTPKAGVVAPKATEVRAQAETLPETGSDAKSFVSVIGALLAGLTVWGFGFKKRG